VNTIMNLGFLQNVGKFLSSCTTDGFSRRAQIHTVSMVELTYVKLLCYNFSVIPTWWAHEFMRSRHQIHYRIVVTMVTNINCSKHRTILAILTTGIMVTK
jgi:hypothetical protein